MVLNGTSELVLWAVNGMLALTIWVLSFDVSREYRRNDKQEERITATEMAVGKIEVKLDYIAGGIDELKAKIK